MQIFIFFRGFSKFYKNLKFLKLWTFINLSLGHARPHKKIGPKEFRRFENYWIQPDKRTDTQAKYIYKRCIFVFAITCLCRWMTYGLTLLCLTSCLALPFETLAGLRPVNRALTALSGEEFVVESGGVYAVCQLAFSTDLTKIDAPSVSTRHMDQWNLWFPGGFLASMCAEL